MPTRAGAGFEPNQTPALPFYNGAKGHAGGTQPVCRPPTIRQGHGHAVRLVSGTATIGAGPKPVQTRMTLMLAAFDLTKSDAWLILLLFANINR